MRFKLFLTLIFCSIFAFGQTKQGQLSGMVVDKKSNEPLQNAILQLYSINDTVFKVGVASDSEGKFSLSASPASYLMRVSYVGYTTRELNVTIDNGKKKDLGNIALEIDAVALETAVVTAEVPPVTVAEDTLVYNTSAFRLPEGSMLEELIKKYPGVQIEDDGTIKINGKTVTRILMKGKDFFGTDKDMALKNVSAGAVDKVKFYDKKSDFARVTGIDDGEEEAVLDLQMKKGVEDGFFSNTDVGYGTKERYMFRNMSSYYNDDSQYTLILSANNVGNQGFSDGRGRGFGGGGGGLRAPKMGGFNFAHAGNNIEIGGNVRANHNDTDSKSWTSSETFMPQIGRNQFSNSRSKSFNRSTGLNADMRIEWKPDTLTNIIFSPSAGYSSSDSWSQSMSATFNENPFDNVNGYEKNVYGDVFGGLDSIAINRNENTSLGMNESRQARARLQVNRRLLKPGRNITFRGNFSYSSSESENFSVNNVTYYQANAGSPGYDQKRFSDTPSKNWSYDVRLSYTEPLAKNLFLQLNYTYSYSYSNSDRSTYVFDGLTLDEKMMLLNSSYDRPVLPDMYDMYLDSELSRYSTYRTQKHEAQVMLRYVTDKINFNAGVSWIPQNTELDYKYLGVDTLFARNVNNISPNLRFRYRWSKQTSLNINYRGSTSQPSMTDLIDIEDDSNPLYITKGNPGLKPSFSNNVNVSFNTYNTDAQRGISAHLGFSNTLNSISRKATYDEATGATISQPDNINGNWNANTGFSFNSAIPANTKFTYSTTTDLRYSNKVSYISMQGYDSSVKSKAKTVSVSERLSGNYRSDNFDVSLNGFFSYSHSSSSAQPEDKMNVYNFSYGPSVNYTLPWQNMKISTNISMSSRRGYSDPNANTDELLWNAQLSASFMARNALTVSFQIYDILQQQSNISRVVDALYRRDSETNAIYSYCMFTMSYKFNNTAGSSEKSKRGEGMRGYGMPPGTPPAGMTPPPGMGGVRVFRM